jgi:hypothetical protein
MRSVSSYEFQMMQKKLERIEATLTSKSCDPETRNSFKLEDIRQVRKSLKKIFKDYTRYYSRLEEIILQYNILHNKTASQVRVSFRVLHRKLDDNSADRQALGLPAIRPTRVSSPTTGTNGSRSRHFKSKNRIA